MELTTQGETDSSRGQGREHDDLPRHEFAERIAGDWTLVTMEPATCSWRAGEVFADGAFERRPDRQGEPSFASAVRRAKAEHHIVLLPHLHEVTAEIETGRHWRALDNFVFPVANPPLHLARAPEPPFHIYRGRCASIDRLTPLIDLAAEHIDDIERVDSTQEAARRCADRQTEYCITNQAGLERHNLISVRRLKQMTIWWHPYIYDEGGY